MPAVSARAVVATLCGSWSLTATIATAPAASAIATAIAIRKNRRLKEGGPAERHPRARPSARSPGHQTTRSGRRSRPRRGWRRARSPARCRSLPGGGQPRTHRGRGAGCRAGRDRGGAPRSWRAPPSRLRPRPRPRTLLPRAVRGRSRGSSGGRRRRGLSWARHPSSQVVEGVAIRLAAPRGGSVGGHLAAETRAAADAEAPLDGPVLLTVLLRCPDEQAGDEERDGDHEHGHEDLRREIHQISASGKLRWRRGGTRKFCRCVVRSTELKPWLRSRGSSGSVPSGSTPSIARRLRWKSSLVGLKTTKWMPAAGPVTSSEG